MLHTGFLLGFFYPEDGGNMFLQKSVDFQWTAQHYIPEDKSLHNHCCENLKPYTGAS
jgi:hypothetical protein